MGVLTPYPTTPRVLGAPKQALAQLIELNLRTVASETVQGTPAQNLTIRDPDRNWRSSLIAIPGGAP